MSIEANHPCHCSSICFVLYKTKCENVFIISFPLFADIDECFAGTDMCDQTCTNTEGSFSCSCDEGYNELPDGTCEGWQIIKFILNFGRQNNIYFYIALSLLCIIFADFTIFNFDEKS